ncbi:hypothetical protein VULLAG_LOCUS21808 [Vulpes lagopus]
MAGRGGTLHLPAQAAEPLPGAGQRRLPSRGQGAEKWGGARSPGKDPRSFPPTHPRGEISAPAPREETGGRWGRRESAAFARPEAAEAGPWRAARAEGAPNSAPRAAPLERLPRLGPRPGDRPAPPAPGPARPGPRWPRASLALAAGGARPVPVTHFAASAARGAQALPGRGRGEVATWRCGTPAPTSLRPPRRASLQNHQARTVIPIARRGRLRPPRSAQAHAARTGIRKGSRRRGVGGGP